MSLNKYMHPRNKYKNTKPSFLNLALKYADFRSVTTQDDSGKVFLDFKNADALRALTRCLLKEDFNLSVDLPMDRLVPTLPLRLNYIHWLEDIVGMEKSKWGFDIGTGASCVYPLLASKMNEWNFLASESDPENFYHAQKNVSNNNLTHLIHVIQVSGESILTDTVKSFSGTEMFDFCMCNPPFFADHMEAQGLATTRSDDRPEAGSVSTASPQECIVSGGEVGFIRQMIEESTVLREKIRVYSSMVGKKSSLTQLKEELRLQKVEKFATTEFCQGKTMRWGIAWTYDSSIIFPKSQFESRKAKPPLQYIIPQGSGGVDYKVHDLARFLKEVLESIKVHCYQGKQAKAYTSITLTAAENTWCHQRRLRRQQHQRGLQGKSTPEKQAPGTDTVLPDNAISVASTSVAKACSQSVADKQHFEKCAEKTVKEEQQESLALKGVETTSSADCAKFDDAKMANKRQLEVVSEDTIEMNAKRQRIGEDKPNGDYGTAVSEFSSQIGDDSSNEPCTKVSESSEKAVASQKPPEHTNQVNMNSESLLSADEASTSKDGFKSSNHESIESCKSPSKALGSTSTAVDESPKDYILKCVMRLKRAGETVNLELEWLDGTSRELMYQVLTFLKNKMAQAVKV